MPFTPGHAVGEPTISEVEDVAEEVVLVPELLELLEMVDAWEAVWQS